MWFDDALSYNAALARLAESHRWPQIVAATAALTHAVDDRDYPAMQQACASLRAAVAGSLTGPEPARQIAAAAYQRLLGCLPAA